MKFPPSILFLPILLLIGVLHVGATCVPGEREEVIPDYYVEYQCDTYRTGKLHKKIESIEECAQICKDAGSAYCAYGPRQKQCVVGEDGGTDKAASRVYFMTQVEEDPFKDLEEEDEEPFVEDCEAEKDECEIERAGWEERARACEAKAFSFNSAAWKSAHPTIVNYVRERINRVKRSK